MGGQARESSGLEDVRNNHLLQEVLELIGGLSICDAFVVVFAGADYQPAKWQNNNNYYYYYYKWQKYMEKVA